jgi:glycogen debranching enzyme
MPSDQVSILDGNNFIVSDRRGDVEATPDQPHGFFFKDTRHLSRWKLSVDGRSFSVLTVDDMEYFAARFFLVPLTGTVYNDPDSSIIRQRVIGNGFLETLTVMNHALEPKEFTLKIEAAADFADLFEVKDALEKQGEAYSRVGDGELVLGYRRGEFVRETHIRVQGDGPPVEIAEDSLTLRVHLEANTQEDIEILVVPATEAGALEVKQEHKEGKPKPNMKQELEQWIADSPRLSCSWEQLEDIYERSIVDLAAIRFFPIEGQEDALPAAGLPWFMTMFGRDSLIASYQALPVSQELSETTLRVLAQHQGTKVDDFRDEEPGKILHELRYGELTAFKERPHSPYYGSCDATPLFLILLDEYERWSGDAALVRKLEESSRAALNWIDEYGDRDGDGYVEYERRNAETGLENQCWKDSWDSILFADGSMSKLPRATCEIQGYVYDAKRRCARLAREFWDDAALADRLEQEAAALKRRFNEDYWIADREFFALALDGDKRKVDSLTGNIGELLWSGIVDDDKAERIVEHLMSDPLFSGWGVRTMATTEIGYNPIRYHDGTVWPHENSLIALGLTRYGFREEAASLSFAVLEATLFFQNRLPEVFAGYPRELTQSAVQYPTACTPQAWATAAPFAFIRAMLDLEPDGDELRSDPVLPEAITSLELHAIPGRWGRAAAPVSEVAVLP